MMKYCPNLKSRKMESHQIKEYEFQNEIPNKDEIEVIILTKMKIHLKSSTIDWLWEKFDEIYFSFEKRCKNLKKSYQLLWYAERGRKMNKSASATIPSYHQTLKMGVPKRKDSDKEQKSNLKI